jgi:hypothetical protein
VWQLLQLFLDSTCCSRLLLLLLLLDSCLPQY